MGLLTPLEAAAAPYLFWIKLAGLALLMAASAGGAWYVDSNRWQVRYDALELADSQKQTADVTASLGQLQGFIDNMHDADAGYGATLAQIKTQFITVNQELHDALSRPLPSDCKPDAARVRALDAAVLAARPRP